MHSLHEQQKLALLDESPALLILAGPGTGKTFTLTQKIAETLRKNVPAGQVFAVTFTRKAADEMRERLLSLVGEDAALPFIGTFHALALGILRSTVIARSECNERQSNLSARASRLSLTRLLRRSLAKGSLPPRNDNILSEKEAFSLFSHAAQEIIPNCSRRTLRRLHSLLSLSKNQMISLAEIPPENFPPDIPREPFMALCEKYTYLLREKNALDFDALIPSALDLFQRFPEILERYQSKISFLFIDEFQDVNEAQYRFIRALASPKTRIIAIGDPDQAIYSFRGSNVAYFSRFSEDFPKTRILSLEENFRSTQNILSLANHFIQFHPQRTARSLRTFNPTGTLIHQYSFPNEWNEASFVTKKIAALLGGVDMIQAHSSAENGGDFHFSDIAVLYRTKAEGRILFSAFQKTGIPCQLLSETPWFEKKDIQKILAAVNALLGREVSLTFETKALCAIQQCAVNMEAKKCTEILREIAEVLQLPSNDRLLLFFSLSARFYSMEGIAGLQAISDFFATFQKNDAYDQRLQAVSLMTLHASKGLEFPVVFITGVEDGLIPYVKEGRPTDLHEERRLFYVGITRAKQILYLSRARERDGVPRGPSPFLAELPGELLMSKEFAERRRRVSEKAPSAQMSLW